MTIFHRSLYRMSPADKSAAARDAIVSSTPPSLAAANSQNCNSLLPSIQPFPGRGGIPPFPLPRVFSSLPSSVRSQMKYNPPAGGRTRTGGSRGAAGDTVSGARLSEIGSFVPLLEGRRTRRSREGGKEGVMTVGSLGATVRTRFILKRKLGIDLGMGASSM